MHYSFLTEPWVGVLSFVVLWAGGYLLFTWGLRLIEKLAQVSFQETLNKVGGLLVGLLRGAMVLSVLFILLRQLPSPYLTASIEQHSMSGRFLVRVAPKVYETSMPWLGKVARGMGLKT